MKSKVYKTVDAYIAAYPKQIQLLLKQIRKEIKKAAPKAEERISYGMPAYRQHGAVAYFGGYKNHIGFYPAPREHLSFKKELANYKGGKGTMQFPLDKPLPLVLIKKIVRYRVKDNLARYKAKLVKKTK